MPPVAATGGEGLAQPVAAAAAASEGEAASGATGFPGASVVEPAGPEVVVVFSDDSVESELADTIILPEAADGEATATAMSDVAVPASPTGDRPGPPVAPAHEPAPTTNLLEGGPRRPTTCSLL